MVWQTQKWCKAYGIKSRQDLNHTEHLKLISGAILLNRGMCGSILFQAMFRNSPYYRNSTPHSPKTDLLCSTLLTHTMHGTLLCPDNVQKYTTCAIMQCKGDICYQLTRWPKKTVCIQK